MEWNDLKIMFSADAMDPGVVSSSTEYTVYDRDELSVGQMLPYDDPSGVLPRLKVVRLTPETLTLQTGDHYVEVACGRWTNLGSAGRDYTNFSLDAQLIPVPQGGQLTCLASNHYALATMKETRVARLEAADDADSNFILGRWYMFAMPCDDYATKAEQYYQKAIAKGNADAMMALAHLHRDGDLGKVDVEKYLSMRDEARSKGSVMADVQWHRDLLYGNFTKSDPSLSISLMERKLQEAGETAPIWEELLGWAYREIDNKEQAKEYFQQAIDAGFTKAWDGLLYLDHSMRVINRASKAGAGMAYLYLNEELKEEYDQKSEYGKQELSKQLMEYYERAIQMGEPLGYYYIGMFYYNGSYGYEEDDEKAWQFFMAGAKRKCSSCWFMLAEMTHEGRAPEQFHYSDLCYFRLMALRNGMTSQNDEVVDAYRDGELKSYAEEIEKCYVPHYGEFDDDYDNDTDNDDDYEEDDGRWDPYV